MHRLPLTIGVGLLAISFSAMSFAQARGGLEFGLSQDKQQGSFQCVCGSWYFGGSGTGWNMNAFWEFPVTPHFFAGLKTGYDRKVTSSTNFGQSMASVVLGDTTTIASVQLGEQGDVTESFLQLQPYCEYYVGNLFMQAGAGTSVLLSNTFSQTRILEGNENVIFSNGLRSELTSFGPMSSPNSLQFSGFISAGYQFSLLGFTMAPLVTFQMPLSDLIDNDNANDWRASSLYGSIRFSFAP
ncbi:MAG TPA: hypothetical protein VGM92_08855 [Candidatus Kapabacteria bacterium]